MNGFTDIPWRHTGLPVKLGPLDARAAFLLLLWMFHFSWWTFWVAVLGMVLLAAVEFKDYTIPNALRRASALLMGPHCPARTPRMLDDANR